MKNWLRLPAGLLVGMMLLSGSALAQGKPSPCKKAGAPEKVEGQVIKIDPDQGKVTIRESDGTTHLFEASKETLAEYKVGDTIKAKLRPAPDCP